MQGGCPRALRHAAAARSSGTGWGNRSEHSRSLDGEAGQSLPNFLATDQPFGKPKSWSEKETTSGRGLACCAPLADGSE